MPAKNEPPEGISRWLKMGRRFLGGGEDSKVRQGPERRLGKRVALPVAVHIKIGEGPLRPARVRDVNLPGLSLEPGEGARVGEPVSVAFEGYAEVSPPFTIRGTVARIIGDDSDAIAIKVDRQATAPEALKNYRSLVLHYLHHKPLLEDVNKGYFEGRCESCGWIGRVGARAPRCSHCGGQKIVSV